MDKPARITGGLAALVIATGFGGSAVVNAADAPSPTHTTLHMRFIARGDRNINFGPRTAGGTEIDRSHGHRVGFDLTSATFDSGTGAVTVDVAVARRGGLLYAQV